MIRKGAADMFKLDKGSKRKCVLAFSLIAIGVTNAFINVLDVEARTFKLGATSMIGSPVDKATQLFSQLVKGDTEGRVVIENYMAGKLGGERDLIEGCRMETVELVITATSPLSAFVPEMGIWDLPYLLKIRIDAFKVLDGAIGKEVANIMLKKAGVRSLGYCENGFRNMTNNKKPIYKPEDLKGLKLRTQEAPIPMALMEAFGAKPTPIPWPEVYMALKTGIVDAQENPWWVIYFGKIYEVQKYCSLTEHVFNPYILIINEKVFQSLSEKDRETLLKDAQIALEYQRGLSALNTEFYRQESEKGGIKVTPVDKEPFIKASQKVYGKFATSVGGAELINKIKEAQK